MPLPLVPVVAALNAGGHLVAHSAGGLIVYSATGGYVAGTYISTAALASFLTGSALAVGTAGTAAISGAAIWAYGTLGGAAASVVGSAGIFGTTVGASGITGVLMTVGILPVVPVIYPIAIGVFILGLLTSLAFAIFRARSVKHLRNKVLSAQDNEELQFSEREARIVERIIRNVSKSHNWLWKKWMHTFGRKESKP